MGRAFPSLAQSILAGIELCYTCSCHDTLWMETPGQAAELNAFVNVDYRRAPMVHQKWFYPLWDPSEFPAGSSERAVSLSFVGGRFD
jgi:hypothetical protein|eukprot:COSAG01_NODE_30965_length_606_cov_0.986193_2_plen_87_part_00